MQDCVRKRAESMVVVVIGVVTWLLRGIPMRGLDQRVKSADETNESRCVGSRLDQHGVEASFVALIL